MQPPLIELIPARMAGRNDAPTELHVLVRLTPPQPEIHVLRPAINLGLVLDHSGSMAGGGKMRHAREAAAFAVEQLLPTDRVSVTIFDDEVQTLVPSTLATDKASILSMIERIAPDGTTALHAGWAEGVRQVHEFRISDGLNRVLLLSDGLANVGLSDPKAIAAEVRAAHAQGVSTTTLGVGDDYNEDLLEAMADAGDGNYYYVESPRQLADIFQTELQGLMATAGRDVVLSVEPRNGVDVLDLLNDFQPAEPEPSETGSPPQRWRLPNLILGSPLSLVLKLQVPVLTGVSELIRVRVSWTEPGLAERGGVAKTLIVPALTSAEFEALPEDPAVVERVTILAAGRLKRQASEAMASGDLATTRACLASSHAMFAMAPPSSLLATEQDDLKALFTDLDSGAAAKLIKRAKHQRYSTTRGRKPDPPAS